MNDIFDSWLVQRYIAHRGLHDEKLPENSLAAFKNAVEKDYAIELDVRQIADGTVIVFHDDLLKRMTDKSGYAKNISCKHCLKEYKLNGTDQVIPTLKEVLELVDGKVPLLIEIKNTGKVGSLEEAIWDLLKDYKGEYAVESFNPYVLEWFKKNAPQVIRGQLSGSFIGENLSFIKKFALKRMMLNKCVSEPHFIVYESRALPNRFVKKYKHLPLLAWDVTSQKEYNRVVKHCDNIIFDNFIPKI